MKFPAIALLASLVIISSCKKESNSQKIAEDYSSIQNDSLKLNQIQIIASHNSYRVRTTDTVLDLLYKIQNLLPPSLDPGGLDYTHVTFAKQFDLYGMRGLEIDIYNDPVGGLFATRFINPIASKTLPKESKIEELDGPGFKVLHIKDVDYNTNYYTFVSALKALKAWSDAHPNHLPLFINIESKEDSPADNGQLASFGFTPAVPFTNSAADALDAEIVSVFGPDLTNIITPDRLRGSLPTLNDVVLQNAWPTLGQSRGKIIFIMEGNAVPYYLSGHPSLQGRAMFTYAEPGDPEAAFVILNNAVKDAAEITQRVKEGYIVRSRSDANTDEARTGDYSAMNACFSSGAHITSTDYYRPDPRGGVDSGWTTFSVHFESNEVGRKNPINAANVGVPGTLTDY